MININDIQVLSGVEAIRIRPSFYIGPLNSNTLSKLIIEAMCILRYRVYKKVSNCIELCIDDNNNVEIRDNGEGETLNENIFTELYACKHAKEKDVHHFCKLGIVVVNALSEYFNVSSVDSNAFSYIEYKNGSGPGKIIGNHTGLSTRMEFDFKPDVKIFGNIKIDKEDLIKELKKIVKEDNIDILFNGDHL